MAFKLPWAKKAWESSTAYSAVGQDEIPLTDGPGQTRPPPDAPPESAIKSSYRKSLWFRVLVGVVLTLLALALLNWGHRFFFETSSSSASSDTASSAGAVDNGDIEEEMAFAGPEPQGNRGMHLILPATEGSDHLCRTIFTAAAMGFPEPVIVNWGAQPEPGEFIVSHKYKITGIKNYLLSLGPEASNDLVVISDAYDVAWNLPANILVQRYEKVIEAENEYIRQQYGSGARRAGIEAKVVFAADKGCAGHLPHEHWCWLQSEPPLPLDLYGNNTDTHHDSYDFFSSFRPRYLNSGLVVGPVDALLAIMERTEDHMISTHEKLKWNDSDQAIIIQVYAEQELTRIRRSRENPQWREEGDELPANRTSPSSHSDSSRNPDVKKDFDKLGYLNVTYQDGEKETRHEFGIAVDFMSSLSHTTGSADHEWAYLHYYPSVPDELPSFSDPGDCHPQIRGELPADLLAQPVPYGRVLVDSETGQSVKWQDLAFYTNMCSGEIPCLIHHNGDKASRERQWPSLWYSAHSLDILAAIRTRKAAHPTLNVGAGDARTDAGERMSWADMCGEHEQGLFVDAFEQGPPGAQRLGVPPETFL